VRLQRTVLGASGKPTFGKLTSNDGKFFCYTLERPVDGDHPCIPAGSYKVTIDWHHPMDLEKRYRCPELLDVPDRSQIQIHIANRVVELLGCIAPGERIGADCVEESGAAFRRLMAYLEGAALPFTLDVIDP
jgi:hypothetical protein